MADCPIADLSGIHGAGNHCTAGGNGHIFQGMVLGGVGGERGDGDMRRDAMACLAPESGPPPVVFTRCFRFGVYAFCRARAHT